MTELDVINDALSTLGEAPLNDVDEDHPYTSTIRRFLERESQKVQQTGWWFNRELVTLPPDAVSSFIYVPNDAIRCDPLSKRELNLAVQRGRRLYNTDTNTYVFDKEVECLLVRNIPFTDLPPEAQEAINTAVKKAFQAAYDADTQKAQLIVMEYQEAMGKLKQVHIRNVKSNFIYKNSSLRQLAKIGSGIIRPGSFY